MARSASALPIPPARSPVMSSALPLIIRTTRASAANLATAQRHAGAAERARSDAAGWGRTAAFLRRTGRPLEAAKAEREQRAFLAKADRSAALSARAMARHNGARSALDSMPI